MFLEEKIIQNKIETEVPQSARELKKLRALIDGFLKNKKLVPPLQEYELLELSAQSIDEFPEFKAYQKLVALIINNNTWEPVVASVPYNRRLLLLPKCFRNSQSCAAQIDELGLLCEGCGRCQLNDYINNAEQLGYHVVVSEGTGAVATLLQSGQIECVVGVACFESFERSFPLTMQQAIPSIAIPLFNSDCKDSKTDETWLKEVLVLKNDKRNNAHIKFEDVRGNLKLWFTDNYLSKLFPKKDKNIEIANKWLQAGGKRWRPLIMSAIYQAISERNVSDNQDIAKLSIAIESFHKASLAHDDIVDHDTERYGTSSLLKEHGMPVTLNTGDLLLSYGYQLISETSVELKKMQQLLKVASQGHQQLCLGQGEELLWQKEMKMPSVEKVLEIFANKTSPAFEVALKFGALAADANENLLTVLEKYSHYLGIAYQIKDDLEDFNPNDLANDIMAYRPSLVLALLNRKQSEKLNEYFNKLKSSSNGYAKEIYKLANESGVLDEAGDLLEEYKRMALDALKDMELATVKILLFRLLDKIIGDK